MNTNLSPQLFLSYHGQDRPAALRFAETLRNLHLRVWFDVWDLAPGDVFIEKIEKVLREVSAVAVLVGPSGLGPWEQVEAQGALIEAQKRNLRIIPTLLPGVSERPELPLFLQRYTWLDLRQGQNPEKLAEIVGAEARPQIPSVGDASYSLRDVLYLARQRLIISGHTLDRFTHDLSLRNALSALIESDVKLTVIQLCPTSRYAAAHKPYHELESTSPAGKQHEKTLEFFASVFGLMNPASRQNLEVLFTPYMPRFRTVIADEVAFLYLYMYGKDVGSTPDLILRPSQEPDRDALRQRVIESTLTLLTAPEIVPYIRCGQLFEHWKDSNLAKWDFWSQEERFRQRVTHEFYVTYAAKFHDWVGSLLEREVAAHLEQLRGTTLVLGCGSGKEVKFCAEKRPRDAVLGIDFSHVAVDLAKAEHPTLAERFLLGDFYDLEGSPPGQFQAIVANASFVHLYQRDDMDDMLRKVWRKLEDGGLFFLRALYKEQNGAGIPEELDSQQLRLPRWFVYFSRRELAERCRRAGFAVLDNVTDRIAEDVYGANGSALEAIQEKGFLHRQHSGVFWPTLLLQKAVDHQPPPVRG